MVVSINQIRVGMGLEIDGQVFLVTEHSHVKPGKGGAFAKVKIKNIKTQQVLKKTLKSGDKFEDIVLEERTLQYLYRNGDLFHFMDYSNYEETVVPKDILGDSLQFLLDNLEVTGLYHNNEILKIDLPTFITAEIIQTEPGLKGDSSKAGTKPASIDTGAQIQVPLFIDRGERVKIDTRTGSYVERVQE